MFNEIRQGIADTITSDLFPRLFLLGTIMFLLGLLVGVSMSEDLNRKKCDEMSITEALQYPYCRNYFEEQIKNMEG